MSADFTLALANEHATLALAERLAQHLQAGLSVYLHGQLGAGKTTLVRGILHALGYQGKVKSPTYTLVEPYTLPNNPFAFYHFDLYRFQDEEEWHASGFREYFNANSVCFVEWPEKAGALIPAADWDIHLSVQGQGRLFALKTNTALGQLCFQENNV